MAAAFLSGVALVCTSGGVICATRYGRTGNTARSSRGRELGPRKCLQGLVNPAEMGKISQLRDAITARGGTWMKAWKEDELQDALDELPEVALPSRRAAANDGEKKRRSGEVEPSLETSSAKKQKPPPKLLATKPHVNEPSEEGGLSAREAVLADHASRRGRRGDRITSAAVHKIIKSNYTLRGGKGTVLAMH